MTETIEVSVVLESYNYGEGTDYKRLCEGLRTASAMVNDQGGGEVLLTDTSDSPEVAAVLAEQFPHVRRVVATGMDYDGAKALAARQARGAYVLYLDGDCLPEPGWLGHHLRALKKGAFATGGFTRYEGGLFASLMTLMDFGFLLPRVARPLQCYASNNSGFRRAVLLDVAVPEGPMRCRCYSYAQRLLRRGTPITMAPEAMVLHELPPFFAERFRQGYDTIAACWVDPDLPEAGWLRFGPLAAPAFYARNVWMDWRRIARNHQDLGIPAWLMALTLPLFPLFRLVDLAGMARALTRGRIEDWGGACLAERPAQ